MTTLAPGADGFCHPAAEEEVRTLILRARQEGRKVRVRGSSHSTMAAIMLKTLAVVLGVAALGCSHAPLFAPVPDRTGRLQFDVPQAEESLRATLDTALTQAVCLVRTGKGADCQDPASRPDACDVRSPGEVRRSLHPAFDSLSRLRLGSPHSVNAEISQLIPSSEPTTEVIDARRPLPCRDWGDKAGACAAFRFGPIWVLLSNRDGSTDRLERVEIFLVGQPCRASAP